MTIKQMQADLGVTADGDAGPNTAKALETRMAELGFDAACWGRTDRVIVDVQSYQRPPDKVAEDAVGGDWMAEVRRVMGLHERADNNELTKWLRSDGPTLGDPSEFPWCGDLMDTALRLAGIKTDLENPYLARNWLKFGTVTPPRFGAIMVFWRGEKKGPYGHVGFYVGEGDEHFHILGGNQSNRVSVAEIAKNRFLGARWPVGAAPPKQFRVEPGSTTINEF